MAAAQPHASGPSSCGWLGVQAVRRHLVAYGSTNKYRPVTRSRASGNTAKRPTLVEYSLCTTAAMLHDGHRKGHGQPAVGLPNPFVPVQCDLL